MAPKYVHKQLSFIKLRRKQLKSRDIIHVHLDYRAKGPQPAGISQGLYHDVAEISDLSQSETLNLVMWWVKVMQPTTRLIGEDEVVVGYSLMFRKMDPWNVIRKYTAGQD